MELNVKEFMETELGKELHKMADALDASVSKGLKETCSMYLLGVRAILLAVKQFYGIEFRFTRTDEYFGVCTGDESLWLMKEMR